MLGKKRSVNELRDKKAGNSSTHIQNDLNKELNKSNNDDIKFNAKVMANERAITPQSNLVLNKLQANTKSSGRSKRSRSLYEKELRQKKVIVVCKGKVNQSTLVLPLHTRRSSSRKASERTPIANPNESVKRVKKIRKLLEYLKNSERKNSVNEDANKMLQVLLNGELEKIAKQKDSEYPQDKENIANCSKKIEIKTSIEKNKLHSKNNPIRNLAARSQSPPAHANIEVPNKNKISSINKKRNIFSVSVR